jgi:hypothetical protein
MRECGLVDLLDINGTWRTATGYLQTRKQSLYRLHAGYCKSTFEHQA